MLGCYIPVSLERRVFLGISKELSSPSYNPLSYHKVSKAMLELKVGLNLQDDIRRPSIRQFMGGICEEGKNT